MVTTALGCALAGLLLGALLDAALPVLAAREPGRAPALDLHHRRRGGRLVVPALAALAAAAVGARVGADATLLPLVHLVSLLAVLAVVDLGTGRLPNALTLPSYGVAVLLLAAHHLAGGSLEPGALTAAACLVALAVALSCASPAALGMGDAKLMGVIALLVTPLGATAVWAAALSGLVLSGAWSAGVLVTGAARGVVAAGPFLAAGTLVVVLGLGA